MLTSSSARNLANRLLQNAKRTGKPRGKKKMHQPPKTNRTLIDTRDGKLVGPLELLHTMDLQYRTLHTFEESNVASSSSGPIVIEGPRSSPMDGVYVALRQPKLLASHRFVMDLFGGPPQNNEFDVVDDLSINEVFAADRLLGVANPVRLRAAKKKRFRLLGGNNG